ncbi:MAG: 3-oxoacyl-ACP reductase FabG [Nitrospirota bacterium]
MSGPLEGRTAVVTGGTRGIGREISLALLKAGASVAAIYANDEEKAAQFLKEAEKTGRCMVCRADVRDQAAVQSMFEEIKIELGPVTALVNNAGVIKDGFLMLMREDDWDRVIDVSLKGAWSCCRAASRGMVGARFGRIINVVSPSAISGRAGQTNYSAAKGGLISLTKSLAREMAPYGITVNAVSPGVIRTELVESLPEKVKAELLGMIPLKRFGTPEEVAGAVLFLVSGEAEYITGQVISVDGGITMSGA